MKAGVVMLARQRRERGPDSGTDCGETAYANLDRLSCLEIQGAALPHGVKTGLYEAAREAEGRPLTLAAAELLDRPPARIGIVTGAAVPDHMPAGENDGPLGSVVLAQALVAMGHRVSFYTDPPAAPPIEALAARLRHRYAVASGSSPRERGTHGDGAPRRP